MPYRLPVRVAAAVLLLLPAAALLLAPASAGAATHTVDTWTVPMTPVTVDAAVGDDVVWTTVPAGHTVDYMPALDDQDLDPSTDQATICATLTGAIRIDAGGTASVNLTQAGTLYYFCAAAFPLHCNNGMIVRVNVTDSVTGVDGNVTASPWGRVKATYR